MKEADPGRGQGLRLRPRQRGITPGKSRGEGARVQESAQGLAQDPDQETEAGHHRGALQEPGPGPQEEDPEATRDPSVIMIRPPVVEVEEEEEEAAEEEGMRRERLLSQTSVWVCLG